uniref:hypothetical protein n=1 Tax=Halomonas sp. TaxID=1486246 RepID=UPI00261E858D|nr:hypothetical protein [Halomonas sp.]
MSLAEVLSVVEPVLLLSGLGMVLFAYFQYVRRTRDFRAVVRFWEKRLMLERREHVWQRAGIVVLLLGVVVRYVLVLGLI